MTCHLYCSFYLLINGQKCISACLLADKAVHRMEEFMNKEKKKKFVRYQEGADIYSMSVRKFQDLAKDAGAIYKVGKMALVNCEISDQYMETFKL